MVQPTEIFFLFKCSMFPVPLRFLPATNEHTATHSNIEYDQAEPSGWLETYLRLTSTQNTLTVTMGLWALSP